MVFMAVSPAFAQNEPQVTVLPQQLERISWSAIIGGTIVALILQAAINLLAIGIGVSSVDFNNTDNSSPKTIGTEAIVAIGVGMIVSLFIGGWMAARFSGMPERVDGMLHGVMVWALTSIVTILFLMTTIGRFVSGIGNLLSQGLRLAGSATQSIAQGAGAVAQNVAQGAGAVVQNVASGAANTVRSAADTAQGVAANAQNELQRSPEVADIMQKRDQLVANIKAEASKIMQQTGVTPERVKAQVQTAGYQIQDAAKEAIQNPGDAERIFNQTLTRLLNDGQSITNQADEQKLIDLMVQRGNVTEDQARQSLHRWQDGLRSAQQQLDYVSQQARERVGDVRQQVESRVDDMKQQVATKVDDVKQDVADKARETAQATTDAISKLAFAAFVALLIGIIAGGLGGYVGAPEELPTAGVSTSMHITTPHHIQSPL